MLNRKTQLALIFAVALAAILVTGCGGKHIPAADSVDSLGKSLQAAGLDVKGPLDNGVLASHFFSVPGVEYDASGESLMAYQFDTQQEADAQRALVSPDGWGIGPKYINWIVAPNYYQNGKLIVIYDGDASLITKTLSAAMVPRFAGTDPGS